MKLGAFILFLKQNWLIFVVFQIALGFLIPRATPGLYLLTFLYIKTIEYCSLTVYFKIYAPSKLILYMNLGINPNTLLAAVFSLDSFVSIALIFTIT
ncbi:MAG: hypothetical protein ACJAVN_002908 [Roseivirga sp.]|jgi:hypothetical protein